MESPWGERDWFYYTDYSDVPLCILQLDPADRAVIRIADERDAVQKKTFTKWVNKHLMKWCPFPIDYMQHWRFTQAGRKILDLYEDLRDGHNLISLLEVLAHDILPRERGHMRFHKIQNVQIALDFLRMKGIKLVNIRSDEIVDGNPKLTLGLIWTIILHFQEFVLMALFKFRRGKAKKSEGSSVFETLKVTTGFLTGVAGKISDVVVLGQEDITAKDALLLWSRRTTEGYPEVKIRDFSSSWRDGKAFLSILHRNRPDLVDIRQMRNNSNKQNLETAFSIAEREFGVTRLLDTDDVDVPNPDEKSIITYVSSLYDVFPEVPGVEQSLRDNERQLKVEEYKELVSSLLNWIRDNIRLMLNRNYPTTLMEIKALHSDFNQFCSEDVPSRLELKNRALRLFDELQSLTTDLSHMSVEDEFLPHNLSRMWSRFEAAMQERDMTLQSEIIRLERLHRLAEKAQRDIRYNEEILTDLSQRIEDTAHGLHMMHAFEAKRICDALDLGLKNVEESLRGLFRDCQMLQDGSHPNAEHLYKRVSDLQAKVSSLRNQLYSQLVHPLMGKSMEDRLGGGITKSRAEMVSESRLMETDPAFRHLQSCLDWIDARQRQLEEGKYDSDLSRVLEQLAQHRHGYEEVQSFRSRIDKCISDRTNLSSEEQKLYTQKLSKVEVAYSLLSKTSSRHFRCLESLSEFLQLATAELMWLREREEVELSREWGTGDLDLPELEEYHKTLVRQMETRESQFNAVQEKGGAMILDRHPSARTVEAYMSTLQSQWSWLVHLSWCMEAQIKHCTEHNIFFEEARHCEQWMTRHSELLQNRFSSDNIPIDQAQVLLAELQNLQDHIREYDRRVSSLVVKSRDIIPLKLRSQKVTTIRVRTLCPCHQQDVSLRRGEECFLVDNSGRTTWKVKTMTGLEADVPSACLLIPPPNQEAIDVANRLKLQHDRLLSQWKTQQRKVRVAAIFAAIRQVKGWDLRKFMAMEPSQREVVWRALKEDGDKLIAECGTSDRDMRKLSEELKQCEQIYNDLCEKAVAREGKRSVNTGQATLQRVEALSRELTLTDQQFSTLLHRPLPQNNLSVKDAFRTYREFQLKFDRHDNETRILQIEVKELSPSNSNIESKLNLVVQKCEQMKVISHIYVDRLKGCEVVISSLNEIKQLVIDFESSLAAHDSMTSDLSELKAMKNEFVSLQDSLQHHQPKLQQLKEDVESLHTLVDRSRPGTTKHHDLLLVEKEVDDLTKRWDKVCIQVVERLHSICSCQDLLSLYHNGLHTEQTWATHMEKRISSQPSLNGDAVDAKRQLESTMAIYNALGDRRYQIESVNRHGGQFIREAKISDMRLKQFKEIVGDTAELYKVPDSKKFKHQDGADVVRDELDRLNKLYMEMVDWTNTRLKQITSIMSAHGEMQFQMVVDEEIPLLRTFRAELAKRSSMFMDEDMKEFFTQNFEGPAPSQVSYDTTPEQLYKTTLQIRTESSNAEFAEVKKIIQIQPKSKPYESNTMSLSEAGNRNLADLSMTLKAMESSSTLVTTPSTVTPSKAKGANQPYKHYEQVVVTIKKEKIIPRGQVLHINAVLNPYTSKKVTLLEALQNGLIDTKTKTFVDPSTHQRLPLSQAAKKGYIDEVVHKQLTSPCRTHDPQTGQELSLIEAIQKKLYDPFTNTFTDSVAGEQVSVPEAVARDILSESCSHILAGETVELTSITHTQAVFANSEPQKVSTELSLGKVLQKGLCSEITGKLTDPISGADMNIMEAVEKEYVNPSYQEIKDPKSGKYITLTEAVAAELVDPFKGTFSDISTKQKLSLSVAMNRGQVKAATSLADVVSQGNITEDDQVFDSVSGQVMSLSEALEAGVISSNKKCILDPSSDQVLSPKEAVSKGIMTPSGLFLSPEDNSSYSVLKAVKHGVVRLVHEDIQFSRSGMKDPRTNEVLTVFEALKRGILTPQGTYVDSRTGRDMSLQQAANSGLVDANLAKDLNKPTSMKDAVGRNISVVDSLRLGLVDTETGCLKNARTNERMTMQEATAVGVISASDATNILGLLSPFMTVTRVLTQTASLHPAEAITVSQAVSLGYLSEKTGLFTHPKTGHVMPVEKAVQNNILKLSSEWPLPPTLSESIDETQSGRVISETFMTDTSERIARTIPTEPGTKKLESSYMSRVDSQYTFTTTTLAKPLLIHPVISETREINLKSVLDPRTGRELDVDDALKRGLINLDSGQYIHPISGEKMSINKAIEKGFIQAEQVVSSSEYGAAVKEARVFSVVGVLHPHTRKHLTVSQATADGILDQANGVYNSINDSGKVQPIKISEAIDKGYVIVEDIGDFTVGPDSMLRETKSYILKSIIHPVTSKHLSIADAIAEGIINESEGLYINPATEETISLHKAIEKGLILTQLVSVKAEVDKNINKITTTKITTLSVTAVVHPHTGKLITVSKAIEDGILSQSKGTYINPVTGEHMTLSDAIDKRLVLAESLEAQSDDPLEKAEISSIHITDEQDSHEASLMEDVHSETVTMSITSVVDPRTKELISYEDAVESSILDIKKGLYVNPSNAETMTITAALEKSLIHGEITSKRHEDDFIRSSVSASTPAIALKDITSVVDPGTGREISFNKAVKDGIINPDRDTYINPKTHAEIDLSKAKELGYLVESKQSSTAQIVQSLEEEDSLQVQLSTPRMPKETKKLWSKVDMELEKTVRHDESNEDGTVATEVLHYLTTVENDTSKSLDSTTGKQDAVEVVQTKDVTDRSVSEMDKQSCKGMSPKEALKFGLTAVAGAPIIAEKMIVDAVRGSTPTKIKAPYSELFMETTETETSGSPKDNFQQKVSPSRAADHKTQEDHQKGSESPAVGVVGKPVAVTVDHGSVGFYSSSKGGKSATVIFQRKSYSDPTQGLVSLSEKFLPSETGFIDKSESKPSLVKTPDTDKPTTVTAISESQLISPRRHDTEQLSSKIPTHIQDIKTKAFSEASVRDLEINWEMGTVIDKLSGQRMTVAEAVQQGLVDSDLIEDLARSSTHEFHMNPDIIIDWEQGKIIDKLTNKSFSVQHALQRGLIDKPTAASLASVTESATEFKGLMKYLGTASTVPHTLSTATKHDSQIIDPSSGLPRRKTLSRSIIDKESVLIDSQTRQQLSQQSGKDSPQLDVRSRGPDNDGLRIGISQQTTDKQIVILNEKCEDVASHNSVSSKQSTEDIRQGYLDEDVASHDRVPSKQPTKDVKQGYLDENVASHDRVPSKQPTKDVKQGYLDEDVASLERVPSEQPTKDIRQGYLDESSRSITESELKVPSVHKKAPPVAPKPNIVIKQAVKEAEIIGKKSPEISVADEVKRLSFAENLDQECVRLEDHQYLNSPMTASTRSAEQDIGLTEATDEGVFYDQSGIFHDLKTGKEMSFQEAVDSGKIDGQLEVCDLKSGEVYTLKEALREGKIDPAGKIFDEETGGKFTVKEAAKLGILAVVGPPIAAAMAAKESLSSQQSDTRRTDSKSDEASIVTRKVSPGSQITEKGDENGNNQVTSKADRQGSFNTEQSVISLSVDKHLEDEKAIDIGRVTTDVHDWKRAKTEIIDTLPGKPHSRSEIVKHSVSGKEKVIFSDSTELEQIHDKAESESELSEQKKHVSVKRVYDPLSGQTVGFEEAIDRGLIDDNCTVFNDPVTGAQMPIENAIKEGLVAGSIQTISKTQATETSKKPTGTYNITGVLDTATGREVSINEAINRGILSPSGKYTDSMTGDVISLTEAMKHGLVVAETVEKSPQSTTVVKQHREIECITFHDAMKCGLINPNDGTFSDEASQKVYSVDEAVRTGLVVASDGQPFDYKGISDKGITYSFKTALQAGIIDSETCLFYDSLTGDSVSIEAALEEGYLSPIAGTYGGRAVGESVVFFKDGVAASVASSLEEILDSKTGEKLSLSEAEGRGLVSVVRTDNKMTLSEAIQSGLIDSDTGLFHDSLSGETVPVDQALLHDIIAIDDIKSDVLDGAAVSGYHHVTGEKPMSIASAIIRGCLDTATATFTDPYSEEVLSVSQAVQRGLLKPLMTVGEHEKHSLAEVGARKDEADKIQKSSSVTSFSEDTFQSDHGFSSGLTQSETIRTGSSATQGSSVLDSSQREYSGDESTDGITSLQTSGSSTPVSLGRPSRPVTPGRMADSYDKLVQDMVTELQRLQSFEMLLKDDTQMEAEAHKVQSHLESHKAVHEEILSHQQPILSLVYQAEQLTELYQEELTPEQVTSLSGEAGSLKKALEKVVKTSDRRLKHLRAATDELSKLEAEMDKFNSWKSSIKNELHGQEECLQRFEDLKPIQEHQKEFMTDIISHQGDIRFMSMLAQKYMEEAKLHKLEVDSYRADRQRPARSSLISMDCMAADIVKDKLKDISDDYSDLKHRCSAFGDNLSETSTKQRGFSDAAFKMLSWLADTEDELASIKQESDTPDPHKLQSQLDRIKSLSSEVLNRSGLMDEVQKRGRDLTNSLNGLATDRNQIEKLENDVQEINARYASVNDAVSTRARQLQRTITQSQGIQGAITDIKSRLDSAQVALTSQQPISLELPVVAEQEKQFRLVAADVNSYGDSMESVRQATHDFIKSGDLHVAKSLEQQLAEIEDQFQRVHEACEERADAFKDVNEKLGEFQDKLNTTHDWLQSKIDDVQSSNLNNLPCDIAKEQLTNIAIDKKRKEEDIVKLKDIAKELREDPRTGSPACLSKAVSKLEDLSSQFDTVVHEKKAEISQREEQSNEFESAKTMMLLWLAQMEARVDEFDPAAVEVDIVEKQIAELQPMLAEYEDQGSKVDEVNDLGNALETLTSSGDRSLSPVRRMARSRRIPGLTSPRLRSPSPTFPLSPTALKTSLSSESSGVSSRKSSSDNLLLDDLSQTQQQILDINQRYEILGERLIDRQQELQNALSSIRTFLQDMQDVLSWLDVKDNELSLSGAGGIPANEKAAKKKLREHEEFHRGLLNKEGLVEDIRKKAQEFLKSKTGVPGLDSLQSQLTDLDEKWHGLRAMSEELRKGLEDAVGHLRDFREYEDQLSKWIRQKEKLLDVLGPVAMEPSLLNSQMEQVQVLKEEFASQEPTLDQFVNTGHTILDRCDANTADNAAVSKRMDAMNKCWNKLQGRLKDREKSIESVQGLSKEFSTVARELANWLGDFSDRIDVLPKVSSQPDRQQAQRQEMQNLQQEMEDKLPQLSKAKDLCQQLCDNTKDLSTKTDLRTKMAALDKDFSDTLKKLESRADAIDEASRAGEEFTANCKQMLDWIQTISSSVTDAPALTGNADLLQKQAVDTKAMRQDMNLKESEIHGLIDKGNMFIHESSPTAETRTIQETLNHLENEWEELKETVKEREEKIKAATSYMQAFQQNLDKMGWWLDAAEERLKKIIPDGLDIASIAANLKELQSLQNELLKKSHDHDNFNKTADSLLDSLSDPKHELQETVDNISRRWDALSTGLTRKAWVLEDFQSHLSEIEDNKSDVRHNLTRWENKLAAHMEMGTAARDPKYIDKIKVIQEDISSAESQLDYLNTLVEGLNISDDIDSTDLQNELKGLRDRHDQLQNDVEELLSNMEAGSSIVGQFQDNIRKIAGQLLELSNNLSGMKPVSHDENELNAQLQEIKNFQVRLSDTSEPLKDLREQAHDLQLAGFVSDPDGLNAQVEALLKQHSRLKDKTDQRQSEIETNLDKVLKVSDVLKGLRQKIEEAVVAVDSLKPIGNSANQIKEQQEELKKFSKTQLELLQKELDNLNNDIQALIKSAPAGVSTGGIDEDIEMLQERWSELSEKVSERERNLDKALLQSGKFKEALASLLTWLAETEEAMANQKPASSEFRVVKAQLQEQKLLQKMIDDKTPSVTSVKDTGNQLLSGLNGPEHDKMDKEIKSLDKRWGAVTSNAAERMKTLEEMTVLAKCFQDIHESMAVWLDLTDKKFASLEPRSPNAGGIEKLIGELKHLQVEIGEHEESVKELATLGKQLQDICIGEDVVIVQVKIDETYKLFSDLKNKVDDSLEQMEEALPLAQHFQDAHEKFMEWVTKVESELRGKESAGEDTEEIIEALLEQLEAIQPYLDIINSEGAELAEVAPGDAGLHVEEIINKDNKRCDSIRQQIEKRADKIKMSRQRSLECISELDDLLGWFEKGQDKLSSLSPISSDPGALQKQLAEAKSFSEEISNQKTRTRDAITSGKKLIRDGSKEDVNAIVKRIDQLKNVSDAVVSQATERLSDLEQALPLAKSFHETHENLVTWLDEIEPALAELEVTMVDANQVKKQQESIKALKKDVADYKPVIDRLNKTGSSLVQLVSPDAAQDIQDKLDDDNKRVDNVRTGVRERSNSIDAAMQQSAEFTDKLEDMLETLTMTAETVQNTESISAHPDKIRQQIEENKVISEDMQMKSDALESVKEAADDLIRQAGDATDPAVKEVRQKLEELTRLYSDIESNCYDRSRALEDALEVSEKFWEDLNTLSGNIKELQYGLSNQEKPALEPEAIREQQEELEAFKEDLAATQADLEDLQETGDQLMALVGETERPEVKKNLDDTEETLNNISNQVDKRSRDLDDVLLKAITFQEELQKLLVWLQTQEDTFSEMEPVANDLETIKSQWNDIKIFKGIVDPKHVEIEALNQQAEELARDCTVEQAAVVREPVFEVIQRWDNLQANIRDRQRDIQAALLNLGQFDQAFKDFRSWLDGVDSMLEDVEPLYGDPKIVELELAKVRVITNDIANHQDDLDSLSEAADKIVAKEKPPEASKLKKKMEELARDWEIVRKKAAEKQSLLEDARKEARGFTEELQDILVKISDLDGQMITSQPVGGLPETAKEQLNKFLNVYEEIENLEPVIQKLQQKSEVLTAKSHGEPADSIRNNMKNLAQRWEHARSRAGDRKKKLEDAVGLAGNFHDELNKFITWLTDTEKTLNNLQPVSRLLDKITKQIEDHRVLQKDLSSHREIMFALDKMGTHLKYFSQKQDVVLIKNLLSSVQHRWEKIVSRSAERTRHLERGYKEAKQFCDSWKDLMQWLGEAEQALNSETSVSNEPEKIRAQIAKHKEFQRRLGAKQPVYDGINRTGSTLQTRCPADDKPAIQALLTELKNRWNAVCGKSVDRQRKLEEGLLFTGQFNEALEALLDWLAKVEPTLAEDSPVHGDLDTVSGFLEDHKAFQQELGARASTVQFVRKSAKDLIEKSTEDMSHVQSQLIELSTLWDRICKLSVSKQESLEQAHKLADDFHNKAQGLLDWLANTERQLRFKGPIPDEEPLIIQQIEDHKRFEESMLRQEAVLREILSIGQDIMKRCHPDAISTMKHWLGVLRVRWEELMGLSKLRQKRLTEALTNARLNSTLLEELLMWLNSAEVKLAELDREPIPKDIQIIQDLISQHQDFQNEMSSKQPSVDRLTKADKRRVGSDSASSHIPVFRAARSTARSKIPTIRIDRVGSTGRKTPDFFGRSTPEHFSGRRTPDVSGRKTPDMIGRRTPDVSGRRTPDRSGRRTPDYLSGRRTPEPGFHNPRVGALFNKWRHVWLMAMYRQRKLQDALDYLNEVERLKNFDFEEWRKRYLRWMNHNKARIMDFFRRQDRDRDGRVTRQEFIDGILVSKFPTSRLEMETVADIFDKDGDGFINYKEFVAALRPDRDPRPETDSEKIMDEVRRQVSRCTCVKQFKIHKIGEGKYRFGDSQKLRLVRILRSTVMVRVGGGWIALDEFLVKNDPCRVGLWRRKQFRLKRRYLHQNTEESKGRTNLELRENFILAEGVSQSMAGFVSKSPAGSSHSSGSSYSGRSASTASGPITKIREKTMHQAPWRQKVKTSPDGEVHQITSHTEPDGARVVKHRVTQELRSARNIASPGSRSSSRASTASGSRPTSRTGSEAPEDNQEIYTTVQTETQNVGGRSDTTVTYQTHVVQTRNVTLPTVTTTKISRIPKVTPTKKK